MTLLQSLIQEWKVLNLQSIPGYIFYSLDQFYWFLIYAIMGYFGKGNLGAIIIALSLYNLCLIVLEGILSNHIILLKTALGDKKMEKYWFSISSIIIVCFVCFASVIFVLFNFLFYFYLGLNNNTKIKAIQFSWCLFPSFLFDSFQRLLQMILLFKGNSHKIVYYSLGIGILVNIVCNIVFVYILRLGPRGSAISITVSKFYIFFSLLFHSKNFLHLKE
jgi:Na+-driven multidrug efflux pump